MKIVAIKLRGEALDEFGCSKYIWATQKQARKIMDSQYTDDREMLFRIGDIYIRAKDIAMMKEMELEDAKYSPYFQPYIIEAIEREKEEEQERLQRMTPQQRLAKGKISGQVGEFVKKHKIG